MTTRAAALAAIAVLAAAGCAATGRAGTRGAATVDLQRALETVCEGRAAKAALRKELDEKRKVLDWKASEIAAARAKLEGRKLPDRERDVRAAELDERARELRELRSRYERELAEDERAAVDGIYERMGEIAREISAEAGYAAVVAKGEGGRADGGADLTDELVARYDARFPVVGCTPLKPGQPPEPLPPPPRPLDL